MATYCISDIHGKLDGLKEMLKRVDFKYDGSDSLYILGDIIDWDERSIETLKYCMELNKKYEFIHIIMGNHEEMFKDAINKYTIGGMEYLLERGHFARNKQEATIRDYITLSEEERQEIKDWIGGLKYYYEIEVTGKKYYLSHSHVYRNKKDIQSINYKNHYDRMTWERIKIGDNPIKDVYGNTDVVLVHGHTIVSHYNSTNEDGLLAIYKDFENQTIAIDCGAKALGHKETVRLACLRLDDLKEYYIRLQENEYKLDEK